MEQHVTRSHKPGPLRAGEPSFHGIGQTIARDGLFASLYTDRGSHYFTTPEAGGKVDKVNLMSNRLPTCCTARKSRSGRTRATGVRTNWQKMIDTGEVANASELARCLKLEVGWVCEVLRMTRLAPDIIRAILDGRQPRHLNLHAMRGRQGEVPLVWEEQLELFGFATAAG